MTPKLKFSLTDFLKTIRDGNGFSPEWRDRAGALWNMMYHEYPPLVNEKDEAPITRRSILEDAIKYVTKDRNATHGEPEDSFKAIAAFWNEYLSSRVHRADFKTMIDSVDVAIMMTLMKVARLMASPKNQDNWADIAGYAACGGEIACGKAASADAACKK